MKTVDWSLLTKYLAGECDQHERALVETWRKESFSNEGYFAKVKAIWETNSSKNIKEPDIEAAWNRVNEATSKKVIRHNFAPALKIAASFLIMITAAVLLYLNVGRSKKVVATTGEGEKKEVVLADGSKVWLNENSSLEYSEKFDGKLREVALKGEAFFEVARDEKKPFIIAAGNSVTKVLGTSFNIDELPTGTIEINVVSGKVSFAAKQAENDKVFLTAGRKAELPLSSGRPVKLDGIDQNFLSWHTGILVFEKTSLEDVAKILENTYNKKVVIENEALKKCAFTSTFRKSSLEEILQTLAAIYNIKYEKKGEEIVLKDGEC